MWEYDIAKADAEILVTLPDNSFPLRSLGTNNQFDDANRNGNTRVHSLLSIFLSECMDMDMRREKKF